MNLFDQIRERPWNSYYFDEPHWFSRYPTMMTLEEMRMLSWVAANTSVEGDIVDLGPFLGGSTVSLAHGLAKTKHNRKIHSFDRFEISEELKYKFLYTKNHEFFSGQDSLPIFNKLTKNYQNIIIAHKGDISSVKNKISPISVLFIDLSKTWNLNDHILKEFIKGLKPGAIIIQQDYLYFRNPWLASTMKKLEPKVELLSSTTDHSMVYGVMAELSKDDIAPCLSANTSEAEVREAILEAKKFFPDLRQREMLDAMLAAFSAAPKARAAWEFQNVIGIPYRLQD